MSTQIKAARFTSAWPIKCAASRWFPLPRNCPVLALLLLSLGLAASSAAAADSHHQGWDKSQRGKALDLAGYTLAFDDEFNSSDITADGGSGRWFAPVHAPYGVGTFDLPGSGTYRIEDGVLNIRATKDPDGKWHSGSIQTVNAEGTGFAQALGYFEARMKFPAMPGAWPAFWLKSQCDAWDKTATKTEIDVVEWYGGDPGGLHSAAHLRSSTEKTPDGKAQHWYHSNYARFPDLASDWHTYGVLITPGWTILYLDRKEVSRHQTLDDFKTPLYPLVSLAIYDKDARRAVPPFELKVDYVRIYAPPS